MQSKVEYLVAHGADLSLVASKRNVADGARLTPIELAQAIQFEPKAIFERHRHFERAVHLVRQGLLDDDIELRQIIPEEVFAVYGPAVSAFVFDLLTMMILRVLERMQRITTFCSMQSKQKTDPSLNLSWRRCWLWLVQMLLNGQTQKVYVSFKRYNVYSSVAYD